MFIYERLQDIFRDRAIILEFEEDDEGEDDEDDTLEQEFMEKLEEIDG